MPFWCPETNDYFGAHNFDTVLHISATMLQQHSSVSRHYRLQLEVGSSHSNNSGTNIPELSDNWSPFKFSAHLTSASALNVNRTSHY